ncbi:hypothetical protein FEV53_17300 [Palleronia caenipelagi]|uniref:Uncharacterized protein n=1 Tax=Palleronia caenipelagi TaxID=2489174 RepID=A0A547PM82_9RHOB|nr:hypothetical protein FEV53_17300 [Palleronia caenipelagi]
MKKEAGLSNFQYVGCGDNAIVVRYSESQAIRFRAPEVEGRANTKVVLEAPFISPVWKEVQFLGGRINFVPFHRSLNSEIILGKINRKAGEQCIHALMRAAFQNKPPMWFYDYYNYDFKFEQVALLKDSTPVIIDQGGIILEKDAPNEYSERISSEKKGVLTADLEVDLPWDGKWNDDTGKLKIDQLERPPVDILEIAAPQL